MEKEFLLKGCRVSGVIFMDYDAREDVLLAPSSRARNELTEINGHVKVWVPS